MKEENREIMRLQTALDLAEKQLTELRAAHPPSPSYGAASASETRPCTCHPDDDPPKPCAEKYALSECKAHASEPRKASPRGEQGAGVDKAIQRLRNEVDIYRAGTDAEEYGLATDIETVCNALSQRPTANALDQIQDIIDRYNDGDERPAIDALSDIEAALSQRETK